MQCFIQLQPKETRKCFNVYTSNFQTSLGRPSSSREGQWDIRNNPASKAPMTKPKVLIPISGNGPNRLIYLGATAGGMSSRFANIPALALLQEPPGNSPLLPWSLAVSLRYRGQYGQNDILLFTIFWQLNPHRDGLITQRRLLPQKNTKKGPKRCIAWSGNLMN